MSDQQSNTPSQPTKVKANTSAANKSGSKSLPLVMGFIVLAVIAFGIYRIEALWLKQSAIEQHLKTLSDNNQMQAMENGKQQAQFEQSEKSLTQMEGQLAFMQHTLNQIPGARLDDWKLAETEYLLRLANQRVYLQHEFKGAHGLFDAANQVLASLDDPSLLVVREQIAKEMLLLGQHSQLDRQGLYSEIQAIKGLIHDLIQPPQQFIQTVPSTTNSKEETQGLWQQILSLVSVRHRDQAFSAPLNVSQLQLLEHNLNLMLEQAQWAVLKGDNTIYHSSLQSAQDWISENLRHSNAQTLLDKVTVLNKINIQQTTPQVSESLRMLRQILQDRTYAPSIVKPEAEKPKIKPAAPKTNDSKTDKAQPAKSETPLKDAPEINSKKEEQA